MQHKQLLGATVTDKVTGFTGVVTGFMYEISGFDQALVLPRVDHSGAYREAQWFLINRLCLDDLTQRINTPSCLTDTEIVARQGQVGQ